MAQLINRLKKGEIQSMYLFCDMAQLIHGLKKVEIQNQKYQSIEEKMLMGYDGPVNLPDWIIRLMPVKYRNRNRDSELF